jgi:NlpC/P60 family putative phage cell wall peptidase
MTAKGAGADPGLRSEVVHRARNWIGTPYVHQASCRGAGTDCLGLLRGIWREIFGCEPELVPPYTADWSEPDRRERLLEAGARHLMPISMANARAGDVLVFRMRDGAVAKHVGILANSPDGYRTVIHAYSGQSVIESLLTRAWARRIAGTFRFPNRS